MGEWGVSGGVSGCEVRNVLISNVLEKEVRGIYDVYTWCMCHSIGLSLSRLGIRGMPT